VHDGPALTTGWHSHDLHQLEYAASGVIGLETDSVRLVLGPRQVAWIPAGVRHISTLGSVSTISVFLAPELVGGVAPRAGALPATPLLSEMLIHAVRWPINRAESDPTADAYYAALGLLVAGWLQDPTPFALPVSADPFIAGAMAFTHERLATITHAELSRHLRLSERSLRRRFKAYTEMTWREYVVLARLLHALGLLASGDRTVSQVAAEVGFDNPSSFTRAFLRRTGETPTSYRQRIRGVGSA
jgi:AraC-like DNA-binding protein